MSTKNYQFSGREPNVDPIQREAVDPRLKREEMQRTREHQRLSDTPFIDSLGPAPNAIILDILHMHDSEEGVTRDTITKEIVRWKKEHEYRIPGGRDSCIFWTKHLESVNLIKAISNRPKRYRLNNNKELVRVVLDGKERWNESLRKMQ